MTPTATIKKIELKSCSRHNLWHLGNIPAKYARGVRVWVREYDAAGKRIKQQLIGFIDSRCTGPRSHAFGVLQRAHEVLAA